MKIDSNLKSLGSGSVGGNRPKAGTNAAPTGTAAAEVQISTASAQLSSSGSSAPVDSARIAEIKTAIAEGRFRINADAIADGLLETARDLLQSQRQA